MATESRMRGAEDEGMRENPTVHSKFDRSRGMGLKAPHLSHPGETAPVTGTHVKGYNENGHMLPKEVKHSNQHDTVRASVRLGTEVREHTKSSYSGGRVTHGSKREGPGVLAGSKRT